MISSDEDFEPLEHAGKGKTPRRRKVNIYKNTPVITLNMQIRGDDQKPKSKGWRTPSPVVRDRYNTHS